MSAKEQEVEIYKQPESVKVLIADDDKQMDLLLESEDPELAEWTRQMRSDIGNLRKMIEELTITTTTSQ